jgi:hypothetical protein
MSCWLCDGDAAMFADRPCPRCWAPDAERRNLIGDLLSGYQDNASAVSAANGWDRVQVSQICSGEISSEECLRRHMLKLQEAGY